MSIILTKEQFDRELSEAYRQGKKDGYEEGTLNDEQKLISAFLARFIVPNFYRPEHFEMEDWSEDKINAFKEFMTDREGWNDEVRGIVEMHISVFEEQYEENEAEEDNN